MSETTEETPPQRRRDDAITGKVIREWWPVWVPIAGALVVGGATYNNLESRVTRIEADRTTDSADFRSLNKRIDRIDRKLSLLVCATDRAKCAADALSGIEDP